MERINPINVDRIPPPVIPSVPPPVVNGVQVPIVDVPVPRVNYPRLEIPSQPVVNTPETPQEQTPSEETPKKERSLPDSVPRPQLPQVVQTPAVPATTAPPQENTMNIQVAGMQLEVPTPQAVAQAGVTAVVGTTATLATALAFSQLRNAAEPLVKQLKRNKFKVKLKVSKPVLHFIEEDGKVSVLEYGAEGVTLRAANIENPEQYIRDLVDQDDLFEMDHKIVIDAPIKKYFTKEGAKRFNYFMEPKKFIKKLTSRFSL